MRRLNPQPDPMEDRLAEQTLAERQQETPWPWVLAALGAHTGWGAYPVLARYLQTVSRLPSMSLLAAGNLVVMAVLAIAVLPRIQTRVFRSRTLWVLAIVVVARATSNVLAARFTLSIYVQLITLMTPFVVALLSTTIFREPIPPYTGRAITVSLIGAILMMSGEVGQAGVELALGTRDWLGVGLAVASSTFLAMYMILVRRTVRDRVPGQAVLVTHIVTLLVVTTSLSLLLGEDWGRWGAMGTDGWLVFAAYSLAVLLGANLAQIGALQHLGAPLVSSLLAWRLVAALLIAGLLLNERLTSLWQGFGAVIVLVTITWYLWQQRDQQVEG